MNTNAEHIVELIETFNAGNADGLVASCQYERGDFDLKITYGNETMYSMSASNMRIDAADIAVSSVLTGFVAGRKYQLLK